jgi:hypothetical protein
MLPPGRIRTRDALVDASNRQLPMRIVIEVQRNAHLPKIVLALRAARRFPRSLDRRHQHRHQHADDRHDHQELDKRHRSAHAHWI